LFSIEEWVYKDCGLTFEKYWIFLKAVESDKVVNPTFEKSNKFIFELVDEGDNKTWLGAEDKD
jgi:hypothetical protein